MAAREGDGKAAKLSRKLQQLRSATHSSAVTEESVLRDASAYIRELKKRVEKLKEDVGGSQGSTRQDPLPRVEVKTLEKGLMVKAFAGSCNPGLLVAVLQAFDEMGLEVVDARVSTTSTFLLEAIVACEGGSGRADEKAVERAMAQAIWKWKQQQQE